MVSSLRIRKVFVEGVFKRFPKQMFSNGFLIKVLERFLKDTSQCRVVLKTITTKGFPNHFARVNKWSPMFSLSKERNACIYLTVR